MSFFKNISLRAIALITLGNLIFALTVNTFIISNNMGSGGVTGLSILGQYAFNIPIEYSYFILNIILLFVGYRYLEKSTIGYTIYSVTAFSLLTRLTSGFSYVFNDPLLVPIVCGVLVGISVGIILLAGGSSAGLDIVALIMSKFLQLPVGVCLLILDCCIILPSSFIIGFENAVYTLIMVAIGTKVIDYLLEGLDTKKQIIIISPKHKEISEEITSSLNRGATILHGYGQYTKEEKHLIYLVVSRRQLLPVTRLVSSIDPTAFMTISNVHKVHGEGFTFFKLQDDE